MTDISLEIKIVRLIFIFRLPRLKSPLEITNKINFLPKNRFHIITSNNSSPCESLILIPISMYIVTIEIHPLFESADTIDRYFLLMILLDLFLEGVIKGILFGWFGNVREELFEGDGFEAAGWLGLEGLGRGRVLLRWGR